MPAPVVNKSQTFYGVAGSALTAPVALVSGGPVTWSAVGLPNGLTLHATTGVISGAPVAATNNLVVPITATNADGSDSVSAVFIIEWPNPVSRLKLVKYQFSNTGPNNDVTLYGDYHLYARWTGVGKIPNGLQWEGNSDGLRFYGVVAEAGTFTAEFEGPYPPNFSSTTTIGGSNGDPVDCFNSYPLAKGATAKIMVEKFTVQFIVTELGTPNVTIDGVQFYGFRTYGEAFSAMMNSRGFARRSGWGSDKRVLAGNLKALTGSSTSSATTQFTTGQGQGGNLLVQYSSPLGTAGTAGSGETLLSTGKTVLGGRQITQIVACAPDMSINDLNTGQGGYVLVRCNDGTLASWGDFAGPTVGLISSIVNGAVPYSFDANGRLVGKTVTEIQAYHDYALFLCSDGSLFKAGSGPGAADVELLVDTPKFLIGGVRVFAYNSSNDVLVYVTTGGVLEYLSNPSGGTDTVTKLNESLLSGKTINQLAYGVGVVQSSAVQGVYALCSDGSMLFCDHAVTTTAQGKASTYRWQFVGTDGALSGKTPVKMFSEFNGSPRRMFVLCTDGTVAVRGIGNYGEAGTGVASFSNFLTWTNVPLTGALAGKTVTSIATGTYHTLFLTSDGLVCSVGLAMHGQLGNGSTTASGNLPVAVTTSGVLSGKVIAHIAANATASYAVATTGEAYSWGTNRGGQLGNNSSVTSGTLASVSSTPVRVNDGVEYSRVSPGGNVVKNNQLTADDIESSDWQTSDPYDFYPAHKRFNISSAQRQEIVPETSTQFARLIGRPFDGSTYRTAVNGDFPLKAFSNSFGEFITGENFEGDLEIEFFTTLNGFVMERPLATFGLGLFTQISTNETIDFRKPLPASGLTYDAFIGMGATDGGTLRTTLVDPYVRHVVYHIFCGALPDGEVKAHLKIQIKK